MAPGPGEHLELDFGVRMTTKNFALINGNQHYCDEGQLSVNDRKPTIEHHKMGSSSNQGETFNVHKDTSNRVLSPPVNVSRSFKEKKERPQTVKV